MESAPGAGVLTGEAAVTLGATNQGMVAGDIVNTASRLQSAAAAGTVLVGESTQRAASASIAFGPAGEQSLKGKTTPVPAFWALRVIAERGGRGRSDTLEAPFVGRDDELRLIKDLYHATVREGRTRLVSITGIGGIGKSRLAWELEKYLDGIVGKVWWHRGRSPAYGAGLSFWALGEMIRGRAGLAETDDERTTRARIGELLDTLALAEPERRWIESATRKLQEIPVVAGQSVVRQGETADRFYIIESGTFTVTQVQVPGGEPVVLRQLGPDQVFGELGLLNSTPRTATVTADTDGVVLALDGPDFLTLVGASGVLQGRLLGMYAGSGGASR